MGGEQIGEPGEQPGRYWLEMLDLGDLAGQEIATPGGTIKGEDFLKVCGDQALPFLVGLEAMGPKHPKYENNKARLRGVVLRYIQGDGPTQ